MASSRFTTKLILHLERVTRFELVLSAWKADVLAVEHYTRMVGLNVSPSADGFLEQATSFALNLSNFPRIFVEPHNYQEDIYLYHRFGTKNRNRTYDKRDMSPPLYQLSYLGICTRLICR